MRPRPPEPVCERCLRPLAGPARCPRHPGAGRLDLSDPDDAEYAESIRAMQADARTRLPPIVPVGLAIWLGGSFVGASMMPGLRDLLGGVFFVGLAVAALAAVVGLARATRRIPQAVQRWREDRAAIAQAHADEALRASTRDLARRRLARAAGLAAFVLLYGVVWLNAEHLQPEGPHDIRGLLAMPTIGVLVSLTIVGLGAIAVAPIVLAAKGAWRLLHRGEDDGMQEAIGLVDEAWDLDGLDEAGLGVPVSTSASPSRLPTPPARAQPGSAAG